MKKASGRPGELSIAAFDHPPLLGAHLSIAGGHDKAINHARGLGCNVLQIFTHNPRQWAARQIDENIAARFKQKQSDSGIITLVHASYLINLVSVNQEVREKSFALLLAEIRFAQILGIPYLILHPGNCNAESAAQTIPVLSRIFDAAIEETEMKNTMILLETTSGGQGTLGSTFEQMRDLIAASEFPDMLGICFDTCHVFAAGYDIRTNDAYQSVIASLDMACGLSRVKAFHLNDSKGELGSHRDRHEHIGKGKIGREAFTLIMNDPRFLETAKSIETPKGKDDEFDLMNLQTLKNLSMLQRNGLSDRQEFSHGNA